VHYLLVAAAADVGDVAAAAAAAGKDVVVVAGAAAAAAAVGTDAVVAATAAAAAAAVGTDAVVAAAAAGSHRVDSGEIAVVLAEDEEEPVPAVCGDSLAAEELAPENAVVAVGTELEAAVAAWVLVVAAALAAAGDLEQERAPALTSARQQPLYQRDCLQPQYQGEYGAKPKPQDQATLQSYCRKDQTCPLLTAVLLVVVHALEVAHYRANLPGVHVALHWTPGLERLAGFEL
jgi:hypothetical protein